MRNYTISDNIKVGKSEQGLQYYIRSINSDNDTITMALTVNAGSLHDPKHQKGAAHFLEHLIVDCDELKEMSFLRSHAYTDYYETTYLFTCMHKDISRSIGIISRVIRGEFLSKNCFERIRKEIIKEFLDREQGTGDKILGILLNNTIFSEHIPIGTLDYIESAEYEDIMDYFNTWYTTDHMAFIIVGDICSEWAEKEIQASFQWSKTSNRMNPMEYPLHSFQNEVVNIRTDGEKRIVIYYMIHKKTELQSRNQHVKNDLMQDMLLYIIEKVMKELFTFLKLESSDVYCTKVEFSMLNEFIKISANSNISEDDLLCIREKLSELSIDWFKKYIAEVTEIFKKFYIDQFDYGINLDSARRECIRNFIYNEPLRSYEEELQLIIEQVNEISSEELESLIQQDLINNRYQIILLNQTDVVV